MSVISGGSEKEPGLADWIAEYIDSTFGGPDTLRKDILYDFFKSAFDGSGADNFYDAGSCIDGRLTSAWHWCSSISEKPFYPNVKLSLQISIPDKPGCSSISEKPFYPIFKLAGFASFDGEFQR
ncbi:hypothetical protein T484DRAFT_1852184 [Baffinella frigidus]|nr:hypothetical protein T484DRAFT_1852184 [Cryptophyta sp. CCMP2293]